METQENSLAQQAIRLADELPASLMDALAQAVETCYPHNSTYSRVSILEVSPQPRFRALIDEFLETWSKRAPNVTAQSAATALRTAALAARHAFERQSVELVWTGPDAMGLALRRTDQALLQVIDASERSLLIVSFVVYRVQAVMQALVRAMERGVLVHMCIDAPEPSRQRVAYDTIRALGEEVSQRAAIYVWPRENRRTDARGRAGVLHAKCAVADERLLFISSANLTTHAMELNMELGVLIRGGSLPRTVADQFHRLVESGMLRRLDSHRT